MTMFVRFPCCQSSLTHVPHGCLCTHTDAWAVSLAKLSTLQTTYALQRQAAEAEPSIEKAKGLAEVAVLTVKAWLTAYKEADDLRLAEVSNYNPLCGLSMLCLWA